MAVVGVGNCASSLVQGVRFYRGVTSNEPVPGLMHVDLGGYRVDDVTFCAAFDVNRDKVGRDLADAIGAAPNNTRVFQAVEPTGVVVQRGPTMDGIGKYLTDVVIESDEQPVDVARALRDPVPRSSSPTSRSARKRRRGTMPSRRSRPAARS